MMSLVSICDQHLSDYPTSFEADCQKLRTGNVPLFSNERHALIQVLSVGVCGEMYSIVCMYVCMYVYIDTVVYRFST